MSTTILLNLTGAEQNIKNIAIADAIVKMYMTAKSFYTEDAINCMNDFLRTGNLNFSDYNIKF